MAAGDWSSRDHRDLPRPCRADAVATPERLQQGLHDRLCATTRTPRRRRQGAPYASSVGGAQQAVTQEFEAFAVTLMRDMPVKRAGQILGESDSRM